MIIGKIYSDIKSTSKSQDYSHNSSLRKNKEQIIPPNTTNAMDNDLQSKNYEQIYEPKNNTELLTMTRLSEFCLNNIN